MPPPIHHLELFTRRAAIQVTLNGIPVAQVNATTEDTDHFAPPINPFLIGSGNVLEVSIRRTLLDDGAQSRWDQAEVDLAVRTFEKGGVVMPGVGPAITEASFVAELAERLEAAREADEELEEPQDFLHVFDNEGVSFADELTLGEPYDDPAALVDYALHIRDLFATQDIAAFLEEIRPKCEVWSRAYGEPVQTFLDSIRDTVGAELMPAGVITDFDRADVVLTPIAGGRIFVLQRAGELGPLPLIQTVPDDEGGFLSFHVVVAPRDGQLRIVR